MQRITVKTSLILIGSSQMRQEYRIYRSLRDVPPRLRRRLIETTSGPNSDTLLIVDQRGKEEIERVARTLPEEARKRFEPVLTPPPAPRFSLRRYRPLPEIALATVIGLILLALTVWR